MGRGLPAKYAKMGFAKGWKEYRKVNKGRTTKRKVVGVKKLVKRKRRRRPGRVRAYFRRKKPKIPLEVAIALGVTPLTPAESYGMNSIVTNVQQADWEGVRNNLVSGFLGMDWSTGNIDLVRLLNPFDMERGRYVKMLIAAGVIGKIRKRLVKIPFDKIPFVGRYIS